MRLSASFPALRGAGLALLAAGLFGVSTPFVQRFGAGAGPFMTAALLYLGAAVVGLVSVRRASAEAALSRSDLPRIFWMALLGAGVGPVALAWGLQRTSGTSASLMLALEAVFTIALARVFYGEQLDRRVAAAMALLVAGGLALVLDQAGTGVPQAMGLLAVLAATAAWGADNALSRAVAERDPSQVVLLKAALGACLTGALAMIWREPWPAPTAAAALAAVGAAGYGLSLRVYLLAPRAFGAARTGSVFAFAPFIGALVAVGLGDRAGGWWMVLGGALMLAGVVLHLAESHSHEHTHESLEHEHAHVHEDGHHDHFHDVIPSGPHSHLHRHAPTTHSHSHVPDAHHTHRH